MYLYAGNNQFVFRAHYGVSHGLSLLNDLMCFSADHRSNMFICSLDAEKCFDSIWHDGLLYKLRNIFETVLWRFLYNQGRSYNEAGGGSRLPLLWKIFF